MNLQQRSQHLCYYVNMDLAFLSLYEYRALRARGLKKTEPYKYWSLRI